MCFCKKGKCEQEAELEAKRKEGVSDFFADLNKSKIGSRSEK